METEGFSETSMNFDQRTRYRVFMKTRLAGTGFFMRTYWWADRHGGKLMGAYVQFVANALRTCACLHKNTRIPLTDDIFACGSKRA